MHVRLGKPSALRANASRFRSIVPRTINGNCSTTRRDAWCDLLATRQGAIALIEAFLLWELRWTGESIQSCLQQLKAFLQSAA
jgi:hypothetical protein